MKAGTAYPRPLVEAAPEHHVSNKETLRWGEKCARQLSALVKAGVIQNERARIDSQAIAEEFFMHAYGNKQGESTAPPPWRNGRNGKK